MREWLDNPLLDLNQILLRQEAVKELLSPGNSGGTGRVS